MNTWEGKWNTKGSKKEEEYNGEGNQYIRKKRKRREFYN